MGSIGLENNYDVIVIGAGFSGMYHLYHLRKAGFSVHCFEEGPALGGTWYWNCYPGARVDTIVPVYQFTGEETWKDWNWTQLYPDRTEIQRYFQHVGKVWDLEKDISFNTRANSITWDSPTQSWRVATGPSNETVHKAQFVILCTGFASKPYTPAYKNLDLFQGQHFHTARWPQEGVDLQGKRVAVIGTGASGVQMVQSSGKVASKLIVFQRTPNLALPMGQGKVDEALNQKMKDEFAETKHKIDTTFAGFAYDFTDQLGATATESEKREVFERLYHSGGLQLWLGNFKDMLQDRQVNDATYRFWREKTVARIKDPIKAEILAPTKAPHPFGAKRVSLEQGFFEVFNQDNVELVDTNSDPIQEFTAKGIKTADGREHEIDVVVFATGFDAITGSITKIDVQGTSESIRDKWKRGVYSHLGMATSGFPNMFFVYGPQAPTAFTTGPACAEIQGKWILECLECMRQNGYRTIEPTGEAEAEWREHVNDVGTRSLIHEAESWYFGGNIPGKPKEALNYMSGIPSYKHQIGACAASGYTGFSLKRPNVSLS